MSKYIRLVVYTYFSPNEILLRVAKLSRTERETLKSFRYHAPDAEFIMRISGDPIFSTRALNYIKDFAPCIRIELFGAHLFKEKSPRREDTEIESLAKTNFAIQR